MPSQNVDFNDVHQARGLDEVRRQVMAAVDAHQARQNAPQAARLPNAGNGTAKRPARPKSDLDESSELDRFSVDGAGVWLRPTGGESALKICDPLRVTGLARNQQDNQAAFLLEFKTKFGAWCKWIMPLTMLSGDGAAYRAQLYDRGFMAPTGARPRALLTAYLQSRNPAEHVRHVPRVGWSGRGVYVLPDETIGQSGDGERVIFHSEGGAHSGFARRGTLERWKDDLARLAVGNSRIAFAVSTMFAGPLLAWAPGTGGGGLHYVGNTSIGKSTGHLIAATVFGKGAENDSSSYIQNWRATGSGLEYQAEQHNDCTLILDELGQIDADEAGQAAYMLANGSGRTRSKSAGGLRPTQSWRLLFLSNGEMTLAQHMESAGKKIKGGQEVRLIPIPAEVAPGTSLENLHGFASGHEMAVHIKAHGVQSYGVAGREWIEYLVGHTDGLQSRLRERMNAIEATLVTSSAAGQVKRGARRFALIASAGELATQIGLTGWPEGEATRAAKSCFDAWISLRGGSGASEITDMLRQVKGLIETSGAGPFPWAHQGANDRKGEAVVRYGFRRLLKSNGEAIKDGSEFAQEFGPDDDSPLVLRSETSCDWLVLPEVFKTVFCKGYDYRQVAAELKKRHCLTTEGDHLTVSRKVPGYGSGRFFLITGKIKDLNI